MSTWQSRVKNLLGTPGYDPCMRRSLQTIVLYEAKRGMETRLKQLRPYQRKAAFMEQCYYLLDQLDFLFPDQRQEILWRTMTSRVPIDGDCAWARLKNINKELKNLQTKVKSVLSPTRSHQESVDLMVQEMYEEKVGSARSEKKAPSWKWEHGHNHCVMAFRLYYNGDTLDDSFPAAVVNPNMSVSSDQAGDRRARHRAAVSTVHAQRAAAAVAAAATGTTTTTTSDHHAHILPKAAAGVPHDESDELDVAEILGDAKPGDDRRVLLQEVRQHLDILKEFEGVISTDEIAKRKRELFLALPPAPSPSKKVRI